MWKKQQDIFYVFIENNRVKIYISLNNNKYYNRYLYMFTGVSHFAKGRAS